MKTNRWTEEKAIKSLRTGGATVQGKAVAVTATIGIRLWGAVDFLVNHCGYRLSKGA
jgi:hypothetical protein